MEMQHSCYHYLGSGMAHLTNFANQLMSDSNTTMAKENPWTGLLVVALMISGAYLLCYCVYTKCCCCCGRKKSPQDDIDRKVKICIQIIYLKLLI